MLFFLMIWKNRERKSRGRTISDRDGRNRGLGGHRGHSTSVSCSGKKSEEKLFQVFKEHDFNHWLQSFHSWEKQNCIKNFLLNEKYWFTEAQPVFFTFEITKVFQYKENLIFCCCLLFVKPSIFNHMVSNIEIRINSS